MKGRYACYFQTFGINQKLLSAISFVSETCDIVVGVVTRLVGGRPRYLGSIHGRIRHFALFQSVQIGPGTHGATYALGTGVRFPGCKVAGVRSPPLTWN
jgi:hypothetical protein